MSEVEDGKICAILSWFFPIGLIWYFVDEKMKKNKFVSFHVKQSLVLAIIGIAFSILSTIIGVIAMIPILGWLIGILWLLLSIVFGIVMFIFWIMGLIAAIQGKTKELPVIGKYGSKFNF